MKNSLKYVINMYNIKICNRYKSMDDGWMNG